MSLFTMKISKLILFTLLSQFLFFLHSWVINANSLRENIDPKWESIINSARGSVEVWQGYLLFIRNFIFEIMWVIVVWAFLYVWYLFVTAQWKPDQFKKAWLHVVYIVVWIVLVSTAWWIITLISAINF